MSASQKKILVVEDETDIRNLMELRLQREGYAVLSASSVDAALELLNQQSLASFDCVIVDWMLPQTSGLDFVRHLKSSVRPGSFNPILMVTARAEAADIVAALESGCDDYLVKPFEIPVLLARVRALIRRMHWLKKEGREAVASRGQLSIGGLSVDFDAHEVLCDGKLISLTPSEFKLLAALIQNSGRVLTRDQLIASVQGEDVSVIDRAIDTHVFGLRKKLGPQAELIETVRGVGYRVKSDDANSSPA